MIVYSKKIIRFVEEIKGVVRDVLAREVGLRVGRSRFYEGRVSYPIQVVVYNHKSMLGYFDPSFYELGFHECLMHVGREALSRVIRHELAHYMTFVRDGEVQAHGAEFRRFCERMGWGEEVYRATFCLEGAREGAREESGVFRKVQKLMALATSSNENEAELAMLKSQQLLLKHHIDSRYVEEDEKVFLKRILKQKKESAKMRAIAKILETFFVSTVYSRARDGIYLEILGDAVNVEIAEYVAGVLQGELDNLWKQTRLKGMVAKNSFFLGLAKGYCNKVQALKRDYGGGAVQALMVIEKKLMDARAMAYPRLSSSRSGGRHCREASVLGERMGRELNIRPGVSSSNQRKLIGQGHGQGQGFSEA
jgi:hypothetical protein